MSFAEYASAAHALFRDELNRSRAPKADADPTERADTGEVLGSVAGCRHEARSLTSFR